MLPEEFNIDPDNIVEAVIHTMNDVVEVSEKIRLYCIRKDAEKNTALFFPCSLRKWLEIRLCMVLRTYKDDRRNGRRYPLCSRIGA